MARKYARGDRAYGYSERSDFRTPYRLLVRDGQTGLLVTRDEYEPQHPQEFPVIDVSDPIALRDPLPNKTDTEQLSVYLPGVDPETFTPGNNIWGVIELNTPEIY